MKLIISIIFLFNLLSINIKAEIVYIDMNFIINKSIIGKDFNNKLEELRNEYLTRYSKIEQKLVEKEKTLIAQQNILSKEEFEKKLDNLSKEVKEYRTNKKKSEDEINRIKIENTKKILKSLNPIITEFVDKNSISLVIPKKNIIVGKKKLDITNKIVNLLNEQIPD